MKNRRQQMIELEDELLRLNTLVRARRHQLARLAKCPNKDCECRRVWRETIERDLAGQVGKIRRRIKPGARKAAAKGPKKPTRKQKTRA